MGGCAFQGFPRLVPGMFRRMLAGMRVRCRYVVVGMMVALVASACGATVADSTSSSAAATSPTASTSTIGVPDTEAASSTTGVDTTLTQHRSLAEFVPPTSVLDSFSFAMSMVDTDAEAFGIVSNGDFVMPDAVACDAGNPAFVSSSMGVGTGIRDLFWFDDGFFGAEPEDRGGDSAREWFDFCPGAPEYWDHPIFLDQRFTSVLDGAVDSVDGFDTDVYVLGSKSEDLVVDDGRVWLTKDGWPIRVEITGSVAGGVFTFFDRDGELAADGDLSTEMVPFVIQLSLGGFNGAQVVRAPDGSETVGPLADPTVSVPATIPPSGELAERIDDASDTVCATSDSLTWIIAERDLEDIELSTISTSIVDGNLTQTTSGMAGGGLGTQVTTQAEDDLASLQADLLFNHRAPMAALSDWLDWLPPEIAEDGELHFSIADGTDKDSTEIASWNGAVITYPDGTSLEAPYHGYLAKPEPLLALSTTAEQQARSRLEDWTKAALEVTDGLRVGVLQAAVDLEALYEDLDDTKSLACTVLATAWTAADAVGSGQHADLFLDEIALQHTLLAIEYTSVLGEYLDQPRLDWLRADNINLETGMLAGDTTGTVLQFFADLLAEALLYSDPSVFS
jgi:hypothetical protein